MSKMAYGEHLNGSAVYTRSKSQEWFSVFTSKDKSSAFVFRRNEWSFYSTKHEKVSILASSLSMNLLNTKSWYYKDANSTTWMPTREFQVVVEKTYVESGRVPPDTTVPETPVSTSVSPEPRRVTFSTIVTPKADDSLGYILPYIIVGFACAFLGLGVFAAFFNDRLSQIQKLEEPSSPETPVRQHKFTTSPLGRNPSEAASCSDESWVPSVGSPSSEGYPRWSDGETWEWSYSEPRQSWFSDCPNTSCENCPCCSDIETGE